MALGMFSDTEIADGFNGFGIQTGDKASIGFGGQQCGFVSYEIKPDGTLEGKWGGQGSTRPRICSGVRACSQAMTRTLSSTSQSK